MFKGRLFSRSLLSAWVVFSFATVAAAGVTPGDSTERDPATGKRAYRVRRAPLDTLKLPAGEEFVAPPVLPEQELIPEEAKAELKEKTVPTFEEASGVFADSILIGSIGDSLVYQVVLKPLPKELTLFGSDIFSAGPQAVSPIESQVTVPPDFVLGPGDSLTLYLWGGVEGKYGLRVNSEGSIFIPRVGEVSAWGRTMDELKAELKRRLDKIFSNFHMSLVMEKIRSIRVYVMGEVKRPDDYVVPALYTAFNVLYLAGGPNDRGSYRNISIIRGGKTVATYDLYDFLMRGDRKKDVRLQQEDVILVPLAKIQVSIRGEVKRPGIYQLKGGERIMDVIELAGGLTPKAHLGRVMVDRVSPNKRREIIDLNLADGDLEKNNILVQDRDDISIFPIYPRREQVVWVQGAVKYPGAYQLEPGMRVSDLVRDKGKLMDEVYMERADLVRTLPSGRKRVIPINLGKALKSDPKEDVLLENKDRLTVYSYWDKHRRKTVSITGEVRNPGIYELKEGYRLSDLLFEAGPLLRSAYRLRAEIARIRPGKTDSIISTNIESLVNGHTGPGDILLSPA